MRHIVTSILFILTLYSTAQNIAVEQMYNDPLSVTILDLSDRGITAIPEEVRNLKNLEELILDDNPIDHIPTWISELPKLKAISINGLNQIKTQLTFKTLSTCDNLEVLSANNCNLMFLPVAIKDFPKLKNLSISNNAIIKLPPIWDILNIEKLNISYNHIDTLPSSIAYCSSLKDLDLSFNPGINNAFNYYLLEYINNLKSIALNGAKKIPAEIEKLKALEYLSIQHATISSLPKEVKTLKKLKEVNFYNTRSLPISSIAESFSSTTKLKKLTIGFSSMNGLPYNITKLKSLQQLNIYNACLDFLPNSIYKSKFQNVNFYNCSFIFPDVFFSALLKVNSLKGLTIKNCFFNEGNWSMGRSKTLQYISFENCDLVKLPLIIQNFPKLQYLNIKGNQIQHENIKVFKGKLIADEEYFGRKIEKRDKQKLKFNSKKIKPYKRIIYNSVGDVFTLQSGTEIQIQPKTFIGRGNKVIDGDIEIHIKEFQNPFAFAYSNFPLYLDNSFASNTNYALEIRAFYKDEQVFIKSDKPIYLYPKLNDTKNLSEYYFIPHQKRWIPISRKTKSCNSVSEYPDVQQQFLGNILSNISSFPQPKYNLKTSKVHVNLKRNKRKKTLNFFIEPQYGYREHYLDFFGNKIKGYPELKVYKNIRWLYVGDSVEKDLELLYFLSEAAKKDKLDRKSTFNFYVLDIKEITISPNPNDDNYLLQFIQGYDTLNIEVLPHLGFLKPQKIQKWHKGKYKKYLDKKSKRKLKWKELDSLFLVDYEKYELELEKFRKKHSTPSLNSKTKIAKTKSNQPQEIVIAKPGLYKLAKPLSTQKLSSDNYVIKLNGKKIAPKSFMIVNNTNNQFYWCFKNIETLNEKDYTIYTWYNNQFYKGDLVDKTINLNLIQIK